MSKKHRGTFADWLMSKGITFHPDTVIVDASGLFEVDIEDERNSTLLINYDFIRYRYEDWLDGESVYFSNTIIQPVFDNLFIEFMDESQNRWGVYFHDCAKVWEIFKDEEVDFDVNYTTWEVLVYKQSYESSDIEGSDTVLSLSCSRDGKIKKIQFAYEDDSEEGYPVDTLHYDLIDYSINRYELDCAFCVGIDALRILHIKGEVKFVDYPRNYRRRTERETGKEPSPFFMLKKNPDAKQIRYKNIPPKVANQEKSDMPLTWVHGHFATQPPDHPLPQFAGKTFWIPAHTRGDKKFGEVKKGYTIRQPKNEGKK